MSSQVKMVPRSALRPAARNANRMRPEQFEALVGSMRRRGFLPYFPIVATEGPDGRWDMTDGHHRLQAAEMLGIDPVPCVHEPLDEDERRAWALALNGTRGTPDLSEVARVLQELQAEGWGSSELELVGMGTAEIDALLDSVNRPDDPLDDAPKPAGPSAQASDKPHVLELRFKTRAELAKVKKVLRKAAGASRDMAAGLLRLVD